MKNVNRIWVLH